MIMMRYLDETELVFARPHILFLIVEYEGEIDEKALERAFSHLCTCNPILRGRIEQGNRGYLFKVSDDASPEFRTIDGDFSLILRKFDGRFDEVGRKFGHNLGRLVLTRERNNKGYVSFGLDHTLAGAGVAYEYVRQLWDLYTRIVEGTEVAVSPGQIPQAPSQVLKDRGIYGEPRREIVHEVGKSIEDLDMVEGLSRCIRLTEDETLHLRDAAKSLRVSVGSLWAGIATCAVVELDKSITTKSVKISTLVDLGRYISPPISIMESTYFVGPISTEVSANGSSVAIAREFDKKHRQLVERTRPATLDELLVATKKTEISINNGGKIAPFSTPVGLNIIELWNPEIMTTKNLVPGGKRRLGITFSTYHRRMTVALSSCLDMEALVVEICRQFEKIDVHLSMQEDISIQV